MEWTLINYINFKKENYYYIYNINNNNIQSIFLTIIYELFLKETSVKPYAYESQIQFIH